MTTLSTPTPRPEAMRLDQGASPAAAVGQVRTPMLLALAGMLALTVYAALPADLNELARRTAAIFVVAAVLWSTEALPLFATSLLVISLQLLVLTGQGGWAYAFPAISAFPIADSTTGDVLELDYRQILSPFSSGIIILFMGGFMISRAVTRHGLDNAIAARFLQPLTHRPAALLFAVLGTTAFFSMWMSNTATTAMMLAVAAPLIAALPRDSRFQRALVLAVPFGANIGGIGTPIGTPPNAVALASLRTAGHDIGFVEWMMIAVPLEFILLVLAGVLLYFVYPPERGLKLAPIAAGRRLSLRGRLTLVVLFAAVVLWLTSKWHGMSEPATALLAAAALTAMRVLDRKDVDGIDWNILILMWGGLAMGNAMQRTGLVAYLVDLPMMGLPAWQLGLLVAGLSLALATFMSHTAAAALIVPMALALSTDDGGSLGIITALACSFAMAFPISTPPNAMAYATRRIRVQDMIRTGGLISIAAAVLMLAGYRVILPLVLGQ